MRQDLADLLHERQGHFEYESGHHGDRWLELERLFVQPQSVRPLVSELADRVSRHKPEIICGPLVEGAFVGLMVAEELSLEFIYTERLAESAGVVTYRIPPGLRGISNRRVAVVNDIVNAGSAVGGALRDLHKCSAQPVVIATLLSLGDKTEQLAQEHDAPLVALSREPMNIWEPDDCPLCKSGQQFVPHPGS